MNARYKAIKKWLIDVDLTIAQIAKKLNKSHTAVTNVMKGIMTSKEITDFLLELGCPSEYLGMQVKQ